MKKIKKICYLLFIVAMLFVELSIPYNKEDNAYAGAKTLRSLKEELAKLENQLANNKHQQEVSQSEINSSKKKIEQLSQQKIDIEKEVTNLSNEITELGKEINQMNVEIEDIIAYYQLSNTGDSAELEYIFDASDFTDFIYRMAITEQLSEYNTNTIKEYNEKISDNENKKVELADKKVELNKKENDLEEYIKTQQASLTKNLEGALSLEDEIAAQKKLIDLYEKTYKCKLDETLDQCLANKLPGDTAFYRPIVSGRVSSNYGYRTYKINGRWKSGFHYGVDLATSHGNNVYPVANGTVAAVFYHQSCGGNEVYINHIVNGKRYTSCYYHLANYTVKVGDNVTANTVIGHVGGTPSIEKWDSCSTGAHSHLGMANGNWGKDFSSYSGFISHMINPRNVVNLPALGKSFSNRTTKY